LRNLLERIGRLGLLRRGLLLAEKRNRRSEPKNRWEQAKNGRAQASRPGKLHLHRVPFHSALNFFGRHAAKPGFA
jgi:hypothetical protein